MVAGEVDTYKPTITVSSGTSADAKINSAVAWCASTLSVNEYFQYDFGIEKTISGIAIQGNPNASEWVKSFKVKYGTQPSSLTTYKEGPSEKVIYILSNLLRSSGARWCAHFKRGLINLHFGKKLDAASCR